MLLFIKKDINVALVTITDAKTKIIGKTLLKITLPKVMYIGKNCIMHSANNVSIEKNANFLS